MLRDVRYVRMHKGDRPMVGGSSQCREKEKSRQGHPAEKETRVDCTKERLRVAVAEVSRYIGLLITDGAIQEV